MKVVQINDSTYICHRFHPNAHLSKYLERGAFHLGVGQKRIGVSLNRRVKIELAKTPKLEQTEKQTLLSRLYDIREDLLKVRLHKNSNSYAVFKDKAQGFGNFFDWHVVDNRFEVAIKQNAVAQRMNKMGKYILFYSGDFDWLKCLSLYREREEIEKSFKALKNELDILPLNTHSEKTTRGFIFIAFLGLIIRTRLMNMMRDAEILDKYSVELLLLQLEKLRKIALADGQIFVTEMTKKQREIFQALNLCA